MALLKLTAAPLRSVVAACLRFTAAASASSAVAASSLASRGFAAASGSGAPSNTGQASAAPAAEPAYTITEVAVERAGKSKATHALSMVDFVKGHTKKLNPLARQVAGKSVSEALVQMALSPSRRAPHVSRAIKRAVNKASGRTGLPVAAFKVEQAWTGKHTASPRIRHHSKGRAGKASKRTSKLWVRVNAMRPEEAASLNRFTAGPTKAFQAALDPRGY